MSCFNWVEHCQNPKYTIHRTKYLQKILIGTGYKSNSFLKITTNLKIIVKREKHINIKYGIVITVWILVHCTQVFFKHSCYFWCQHAKKSIPLDAMHFSSLCNEKASAWSATGRHTEYSTIFDFFRHVYWRFTLFFDVLT